MSSSAGDSFTSGWPSLNNRRLIRIYWLGGHDWNRIKKRATGNRLTRSSANVRPVDQNLWRAAVPPTHVQSASCTISSSPKPDRRAPSEIYSAVHCWPGAHSVRRRALHVRAPVSLAEEEMSQQEVYAERAYSSRHGFRWNPIWSCDFPDSAVRTK